MNGKIVAVQIQSPQFTAADGTLSQALNARVPVDATGAFRYSLVPNAGTNASYRLIYQVKRSVSGLPPNDSYSEEIVVPVSATAIPLSQCRTAPQPIHTGAR